jgi:NAD(P)H-nitrite reductase large subunit
MRRRVTRCVCHGISFAAILEIMEDRGIENVRELQERQICSCSCKICIPYIVQMIKTGETSFEPGLLPKSGKNRTLP